MIAPPLTPHLFLLRTTIITNNYRDIPPKFGQTIAVRHDRDCDVQFEYSYKQLHVYHVEKFFKIIQALNSQILLADCAPSYYSNWAFISKILSLHQGSPLQFAAGRGHVDTVRCLVELGADINIKNNYGGSE